MRLTGLWYLPLLATLVVSACGPRPGPVDPSGAGSEGARPEAIKTLSVVLRTEPFDLTDTASSRNRISVAMFGAALVNADAGDNPVPVLAEAAPQLHSEDWRVFPDGRMETIFRLKSGLKWHDGIPLTAEDFVFTRRANAARTQWGLSVSSISPIEQRAIDEIRAQDSGTVVIRWRQPYPDAATPEIKVLPRHILEPVLDQAVPELFGSHPYWTTEYVGVGPYRLSRWEQGAYLEGTAFDGFALGRPKIERIRLTWSGDPNVTLARLLAGDAHVALDEAIKFEQTATLRRQWSERGVILMTPTNLRKLDAQHRSEYASPQLILDPRLRRATAHAIDRKALADAITDGEGIVAETVAPPIVSYYEAVERTAARYPYDVRRTEQLMADLGLVKGSDGFFTSSTTGRHAPEVVGVSEGQEGQETTIVVDSLRRAGIDAQLRLVPAALMQQSDEMKATYPAWRVNNHYTTATPPLGEDRMLGSRAATVDNRWSGTNKSGWSHAEHDRLFDGWNRALDRGERNQLMVQIVRLTSDELPFIPLYFSPNVVVHVAELRGPQVPALQTTIHGNVHEWTWR